MPGNGDFIADIVPVDFVSRHILLSIPYIIH
jgi:Male sterility protein